MKVPTRSSDIARDIRAIDRRLVELRSMQADLTSRFVLMGPGRAGQDALAAYGAGDHLAALIDACRCAVADLHHAADRAEIAEMLATMRGQTGAQRVATRAYVRDLIAGVRNAA